MEQDRSFTIEEHNPIPGLSLFLGFGAMLPIAAGTILAYLLPAPGQEVLRDLTLLWSAAILLFLSGVRRGLAFRTPPAGETAAQIVATLWLFVLGFAALLLIQTWLSPVVLTVGYLSIAILDPLAARRREAPLFFARLRPVQMAIPIGSLIALALL